MVQVRIHKACSLAKCFTRLGSRLAQTNRSAPRRVTLFQNLILSSVQSNMCCLGFGTLESSLYCVSCNLRPGVLLVFFALWLSHLDLDCGAIIRCVYFYTVPHSCFEVRRCVRHTLRSDVNESDSLSLTLSLHDSLLASPAKILSIILPTRSRNSSPHGFVTSPCDVSNAYLGQLPMSVSFNIHRPDVESSTLNLWRFSRP